MFENSVHFLPTFRTPYTSFKNNSVPVPFTHLRVQNFSVFRTSFFEINPYTSRTCTSFSFFTRTPYCFRFRTKVRMTEYLRIRTRTPGSGTYSVTTQYWIQNLTHYQFSTLYRYFLNVEYQVITEYNFFQEVTT